jgi:hypothetical protein
MPEFYHGEKITCYVGNIKCKIIGSIRKNRNISEEVYYILYN